MSGRAGSNEIRVRGRPKPQHAIQKLVPSRRFHIIFSPVYRSSRRIALSLYLFDGKEKPPPLAFQLRFESCFVQYSANLTKMFIWIQTKMKSRIDGVSNMAEDNKNAPSPRRGQYGDTAQRCAWCGKPTNYLERAFVGGFLRKNYCSYACMAAGDYYWYIGIAVIFPILVLFVSSLGSLSLASILLFVGFIEFILLMCVCLGHSVRRTNRIFQEELRK